MPDYIVDNEVVRVALRMAKEKANTEDWQQFIMSLADKIKALQAKLDAAGLQGTSADNSRLSDILTVIESKDFDISHYDDSLVWLLVEKITVASPDKLEICFEEFGTVEAVL